MTGYIGSPLLRERLFAVLRREIVRTMRAYHKPPRVGLVSSYDPKKGVKVQFQPEGTISGWIPLTALAVGNLFGVHFAPNIKDQVEVHFQEGDHMVARVMTRHFSADADKQPEIQAGEYHLIHGSGAVIRMLQDGTVQIGGASTVTTGNIGGGQSGNLSTGKQGQVTDPNQQGTQQQPAKPNAKQLVTLHPDGSMEINSPNGTMTLTAPTIVLNGFVKIGGADAANPVSMLGTIDTHGDAEASNLATKAVVK